MACRHVYLAFAICVLVLPPILAGLLGTDTYSNDETKKEADIEERLLSRLQAATKQRTSASDAKDEEDRNNVLENSDTSDEEETVQRIDSDNIKIDLTSDKKLIEERLIDCKKRYELIIVNADGTNKRKDVCYLHRMEQRLYDSVCKGTGEKFQTIYNVQQEVKDKDFLSQDGPDSVCKTRPMYSITLEENLTADDLPVRAFNKRGCSTHCCSWGWFFTAWYCYKVCRNC